MEQITDEYLDHLTRVSGGIYALIERVPELITPEDIDAAHNLFDSLEYLANKGGEGLDALEELDHKVVANYPLSSTLRPVFRRISAAIRRILHSKAEFEGWREGFGQALEILDANTSGDGPEKSSAGK